MLGFVRNGVIIERERERSGVANQFFTFLLFYHILFFTALEQHILLRRGIVSVLGLY